MLMKFSTSARLVLITSMLMYFSTSVHTNCMFTFTVMATKNYVSEDRADLSKKDGDDRESIQTYRY